MGISENFLVNTDSFNPIIKALVEREDHPQKISDQMLEDMGYTNPSDLLVMHVLRGLEIIDDEKQPTDLYYKMVDAETTKEALAEGVLKGYGELFERKPEIHKMPPDELRDELKEYFGDKKTDLIIKYIANTFQKLVSYAGYKNIEKARIAYLEKQSIPVKSTASTSEENDRPDISDSITQDSVKSRSMEEILFGDTPPEADESQEETESREAAEAEHQEATEAGEKDEQDKEEPEIPEKPEAAAGTEQEEAQAEAEEETEDEAEDETKSEPSFESEIHEYRPEDDREDEEETIADHEQEQKEIPAEKAEAAPAAEAKLNLSSRKVQKAIIRRADLQYKLEYYPEALESVEQILSYFEDADEAFLKDAVQNAVIRRVDILNKLNKEEELLPALNEVINCFSDSANKSYYHHASMAMLQKAELLEQSDFDAEDLLPLYDTIIERLEDSTDPAVQDKVTNIFAKRLELLERSGGRSEYLDALGTSIVRFKDARRYRKYLEEAMFRKAELLERMDHNEEALDAYNAFLEEFGHAIEI